MTNCEKVENDEIEGDTDTVNDGVALALADVEGVAVASLVIFELEDLVR